MKAGYWIGKGFNLSYIVQKGSYIDKSNNEMYQYQLFCVQSKKFHYTKEGEEKNFITNHKFIEGVEKVQYLLEERMTK